jgi:hypothetical protein
MCVLFAALCPFPLRAESHLGVGDDVGDDVEDDDGGRDKHRASDNLPCAQKAAAYAIQPREWNDELDRTLVIVQGILGQNFESMTKIFEDRCDPVP